MPEAPGYLVEVILRREKVPSFDEYPYSLPVVRHLETLALHPKATFLVGENGSGKSTLLEAIATAWGLNPEGGSRSFRVESRATHSPLHECLRLSRSARHAEDAWFLRAESLYNVATEIERLEAIRPGLLESYGGVSLHERSHGESFFAVFLHRFGGRGMYFLDEPEAALSPSRQLAFLSRLHQLAREGSQFVIATHSPILMAYPDAWIYECTARGLARVAYEDTEHYRVTRDFLVHPRMMLDVLLRPPKGPDDA